MSSSATPHMLFSASKTPLHESPLTTLSGARTFATHAMQFLAKQFNEGNSEGTFLVLFMTHDPKTGLIFPNSPIANHVNAFPVVGDSDRENPPVYTDPFDSPETKKAFCLGVRHLAAHSGSVGILLAHEAWLILGTPNAPIDPSVAPSEHPDRQEVVLLTLQHHSGTALWQAPILRNSPDDGHPALGAFQEIPLHGLTGSGQLWNLLPQPFRYN